MKTTKLITGLAVVALMAFIAGCKKEPGPGGKAHIHGHVHYEANDETISDAMVSIWYGETSVNGDADDNATTDAAGKFEFENLHKGDYYLFASGLDSAGTVREGSLAVTISKKSEEVDADIDVE